MVGERVQFGPFEADLATGELFHHGEKLPLQEKPFEILVLLLRSPGQLVTREEIVSTVWPDVFVESDLSLNTAVRRLRASLEKADPQTELIETVGRRGYRLRAGARPFLLRVPASPHSEASRARDDIRLAVLPFSNLDDHGQDHFSDGLTAQMIVQLGRMYKHLSVFSPVTALYFSGTGKSLSHLAHRLQADYVLVGTASHVPPQLRITARLIRSADQCCVWSESYTRLDADIFVVQDEITRSIARSLLQALPELSVVV